MLDRRRLLTAMAVLPVTARASTGGSGSPRSLRLATLNIWHNQGDWPARLPLIIADLKAQDADVIALQEVLQDPAIGLPNQAETIAEALGYRWTFSSADDQTQARRYGNAILTRLPILAEDWNKLAPLDDYRTALRVRLDLRGKPVHIVCTHLAWQEDAGPVRARQIADVMAWLPRDATPVVVMGDFNAPVEDSGLSALTATDFFSALPRGSVPTTLNPAKGHPNRVIDHIFARTAEFAPGSANLFAADPVGEDYASDHFGVAATVHLR